MRSGPSWNIPDGSDGILRLPRGDDGTGVESKRRDLPGRKFQEDLFVLRAENVDLADIRDSQDFCANVLDPIAQLPLAQTVARERVYVAEDVAEAVVEAGTYDPLREIALDVRNHVADARPGWRDVGSLRRVVQIDEDGGLARNGDALGIVERLQLFELLLDPVGDLARHSSGEAPGDSPHTPQRRPARRRPTHAALPMPTLRRPYDRDRGVRARLRAAIAPDAEQERHLMSQTSHERRQVPFRCAGPRRQRSFSTRSLRSTHRALVDPFRTLAEIPVTRLRALALLDAGRHSALCRRPKTLHKPRSRRVQVRRLFSEEPLRNSFVVLYPRRQRNTIMDREHVKGAAEKAKGAIKEGAGKLSGDKELETEGKIDKAKGSAHNAAGDVKDAARDAADAIKK
jgi:uncharacterized protein YjbJ (UPF0337 family)